MKLGMILTLTLTLLIAHAGFAQTAGEWDLMTNKEIGVDRFLEKYPDFDGKGVVIAVLDTGVDMGVEGLKVLPTGEVKVVDVRDFSTEGDLYWVRGDIVPAGENDEKLATPCGKRSLKGFRKAAEGAANNDFYLVFLDESKFLDSDVSDMNGDGDSKDAFGILIYMVKEEIKGEEGKESTFKYRYEGVVDVNGDGDLSDGVRFSDYYRKHETFSLKGKKGDRRQLTFAANFYPEEKRLSLHFDDGGHGTHVAGIAAGYKVHGQENYHGMAPGAKVISLKIGNNRYSGGSTVTESVKKALDYGVTYAKKHKVPLVYNMSFGIGSEKETLSAIDKYVDDILKKNPGVVFVTSAGNEGPGISSVGTPAAAIRAITVGASLGVEAASAQYGCIINKEVLFSFSSRGGDTFKPDILAPGSAASTVPPWGNNDHMNGTSMASPAAAGAIALLVDGITRHEKKFKIDNALVLRAVKNTGRHLDGWNVLDEGGGMLDLPAAYEYAKFLYETKEDQMVREYRITQRSMAPGFGCAYWRFSNHQPRKTETMNFTVFPTFNSKVTAEDKARFYRAFDLKPDVEWLSLTKPLIYLKGPQSASVGVMADMEGKAPGLYTGKVKAYRKSADQVNDGPIHEFDFVVTVLVPFRTTPENRGIIRTSGKVDPGFVDRIYVEVPAENSCMALDLRMIEGGNASSVSASIFDPDGVNRGRVGSVSESRSTESHAAFNGSDIIPGVWEIVVSSSIRSSVTAKYDLTITLSGCEMGSMKYYAKGEDHLRGKVQVKLLSTMARKLAGTVTAKCDGFRKKELIQVKDSGKYVRKVKLDNQVGLAGWVIEFDRETYALFTDCVLRLEEVKSGKVIRNMGLGTRSDQLVFVPSNLKEATEYQLVLLPAFSLEKDTKSWSFSLIEVLNFKSGPIDLKPVAPRGGRVNLNPFDWVNLDFELAEHMPVAPEGYFVNCMVELKAGDLSYRKGYEMQ